MAEEKKDDKKKKGKNDPAKKKKRAFNFLKIGKIFLLLLILAGQGYLAYFVVDMYYPDVYAKLNEKSPADFGTYEMEELVVNPANTNGRRYLLVEISLVLDDKEHIPMLEENNYEVKQEIIEALSARTVNQLTTTEERELLRSEISGIINSSIGVRSVRNLYFTKYVMQ